ncbi:MAG: DNA gyrase C-terminal beta-propeller domain-containing protein, partial [Patescibacteria group bacterium]
LVARHGDDRRTKVVATGITAFNDEDLIPKEGAVITLSSGGYVKRLPPDSFKSQRRGGKGLIGSDVTEEDFLTHFLSASTHDNILFFTDRGRVFQTKVYEIPAASRISKGRAIHNFLELGAEEKVSAIVAYSANAKLEKQFLVLMTRSGLIKKTSLKDFENIRRTGIIAIALKKGDALQGVRLSSGKDQVIVTTERGQSIRFRETQARPMGRTAAGTRAIRLRSGDRVAGFDILSGEARVTESHLLVVMANGFGKRTPIKEYKVQNRGGSGVKTANVTAKTGRLIAARLITDEAEILALSAKGQVIRTELKSVRQTGRSAQGVRLMNMRDGDQVAGVVVI